MRYTRLGQTGLEVSQLAVGAALFAEGGPAVEAEGIGFVPPKEADRIVRLAIDQGINLFDTAYSYCEGQSETILGNALGARRKDIVLATKCGGRQTGIDGSPNIKSSRRAIMQQVETSLRRLKTDWIDLYQVHLYDPSTPMEETLRALDDLIQQGKVRYIGSSNFTGWQIAKAAGISQTYDLASYCSAQINYSLVSRGVEREIMPALLDRGVGALIWSPLSRGILSGVKRAEHYSDDVISQMRVPIDNPSRARATLSAAEEIADRHSASVAQVALAWLLQKPGVTSLLMGALNESQLQDNLNVLDLKLGEEEILQLDQAGALPIEYPGWGQLAVQKYQ